MPRTLRLYDKGGDVAELQALLNCSNKTRLPRLKADGDFGAFTKARVMEFQFQRLFDVDGVVGPQTYGGLATVPCPNPKAAKPQGRCILVNLIKNNMYVYLNGVLQFKVERIRGGTAVDPSTQGVFDIPKGKAHRKESHTSSKYPEPPGNMDFSLFYLKSNGEAIHQGPSDEPSHGCIHVDAPHAERLFRWAGEHDVMAIVVKERQ
jgi:hypothetical protein